MTVDVGQILDKYELLEKVGQGGMAVVYRGMDRSLKREVAVKVLHRHLAEHQEARNRFEREAHAVAKLRHENILEIFDFSGVDSDESYIVTEFIEGQTLKEFIGDHDIKFPEIGAMIAVQVCKALGHAHSVGVLHRDIKPENIMIRNDGVVKLMDFGIAQMLDLQRMTVTGQLLGSPAYMSPEHVEGGQLDFRTDVFAVGILLYQLVTGQLPFRGKNPHEILKRIAEGRHTDSRKVNPQVGKDLGDIIARALERDQDDRYADISEMHQALEVYLHHSGLEDYRGELARFFSAPISYEMALRSRLVDNLTRRGRDLLADDRVAALEAFNRVLTLDPDHQGVLDEIDRLSRRRRSTHLGLIAVGVVAAGVLAYGARVLIPSGDDASRAAAVGPADAGGADASASTASAEPLVGLPSPSDAAPPDAVPPDAAPPDARARRAVARRDRVRRPPRPPRRTEPADAAPPEPTTRRITLNVFPQRNTQYRVAGGAWQPASGGEVTFEASTEAIELEVRNQTCCEETNRTIPAGTEPERVQVSLGFLPASITPECPHPGTIVRVAGRPARPGRPTTIPLGRVSTGTREVQIIFYTRDGSKYDKKSVTVRYNEDRVVQCSFD